MNTNNQNHRFMWVSSRKNDLRDQGQINLADALFGSKVKVTVSVVDNESSSVDGLSDDPKIYRAWVHNCAKIAYNILADSVVLDIRHSLHQADLIVMNLVRFVAYCLILLGMWLMFGGSFGTGLWFTVMGLLVKLIQEFVWNKIK
jgi:hypothetical protein